MGSEWPTWSLDHALGVDIPIVIAGRTFNAKRMRMINYAELAGKIRADMVKAAGQADEAEPVRRELMRSVLVSPLGSTEIEQEGTAYHYRVFLIWRCIHENHPDVTYEQMLDIIPYEDAWDLLLACIAIAVKDADPEKTIQDMIKDFPKAQPSTGEKESADSVPSTQDSQSNPSAT